MIHPIILLDLRRYAGSLPPHLMQRYAFFDTSAPQSGQRIRLLVAHLAL